MVLYVDRTATHAGRMMFEGFTSLRWRRKYFEPGEMELHVPPTEKNIEDFTAGAIISRDEGAEAAIVTGIQLTPDDMKITGSMLSSKLGDRIINTFNWRGKAGDVMTVLAKICGFEADTSCGGEHISVNANLKNGLVLMKGIARASGIGYRIRYEDFGTSIFETYIGGVNGEEESYFFSCEDRNILDASYTFNNSNFADTAVVVGDSKILRVGEYLSGRQKEVLVSAKDLKRADFSSDREYDEVLEQRGLSKLAECTNVESFEGDVIVEPGSYRRDWDLGNIARITYEPWGLSKRMRITEVEEIYEKGMVRILPVFGTPAPEAIDFGGDY